MPGRILTDSERERYQRFPRSISSEDLIAFFTLTDTDRTLVLRRTGDYNQLGFALQLCALRYLGFAPDDLSGAPAEVVSFVARQLGMAPDTLTAYGGRVHTRRDQLRQVQVHLGFTKASSSDLRSLANWLLERALEHDRPTILLEQARQKLYDEKIVRPGLTTLEEMIAQARRQAQEATYSAVTPLLTPDRKATLDRLLILDEGRGRTPLSWLREPATTNSSRSILDATDKLSFLRGLGVDGWNLATLNPNRLKFLARLGKKATNPLILPGIRPHVLI